MVIRSSSSRDVEQLMADLRDGSAGRRDAAVARLRVIGNRADERLASFIASNEPTEARVAALTVLDGRDGRRPRQIAQAACDDPDPAIATAAITVLRGWVAREDGTESLDLLSRVALDANRDDRVRLAALDALSELPADIIRPLLQQMPPSLRPEAHPVASLDTIDDPLAMSDWITAHRDAPLSALHAAVVRAREREQAGPPAPIRQAWVTARGSAHAALAARNSRVALYDLRESFDTATHPLPPDFLTAMAALGDAACLEAVAHAWSTAPDEVWWRGQLCDVAAAILKREKLTGRHATVKRLKAKYPGFP